MNLIKKIAWLIGFFLLVALGLVIVGAMEHEGRYDVALMFMLFTALILILPDKK